MNEVKWDEEPCNEQDKAQASRGKQKKQSYMRSDAMSSVKCES